MVFGVLWFTCVTVCVVSVIPVPLKNRMRVQAVRVNERYLLFLNAQEEDPPAIRRPMGVMMVCCVLCVLFCNRYASTVKLCGLGGGGWMAAVY